MMQRLMDQAAAGALDLGALAGGEVVEERLQLAEEIGRITSEFAPLAERCFRALAAGEEETGKVAAEDYELVREVSGMGPLHDALWILASNVEAARLERPNFEPGWWVRDRAELGLTDGGSSNREPFTD